MKQGFGNILDSKTFKMLKDSVLCCGHPHVEIGGVKWATMNVGANSITDTGLYFQWGDTQGYTASQVGSSAGKKNFGWNNYEYDNGLTFTKYNGNDGLSTLEASDDAVTAAWGGSWRMPTLDEFAALRAAVTEQWVTDYQGSGVSGMVLTDNTDSSNVLFFPACGFAGYDSVYGVGDYGFYWSSSLYAVCSRDYYAYSPRFINGAAYWQYISNRCYGCAVRGVLGA